jgi:hypothetical protein
MFLIFALSCYSYACGAVQSSDLHGVGRKPLLPVLQSIGNVRYMRRETNDSVSEDSTKKITIAIEGTGSLQRSMSSHSQEEMSSDAHVRSKDRPRLDSSSSPQLRKSNSLETRGDVSILPTEIGCTDCWMLRHSCSEREASEFCANASAVVPNAGCYPSDSRITLRAAVAELDDLLRNCQRFQTLCIATIEKDTVVIQTSELVSEVDAIPQTDIEAFKHYSSHDNVISKLSGSFNRTQQETGESQDSIQSTVYGNSGVQNHFWNMSSVVQHHFWNHDRIDQRTQPGDGRLQVQGTGDGVHVYIASTGIHTQHNFLQSRAIPQLDCRFGTDNPNCIVCDHSNFLADCGMDSEQAGTHMAGIIGSAIYGIAPDVRMYAVKVVQPGVHVATTLARIEAALDWVRLHGQFPAIFITSFAAAGQHSSFQDAVKRAAANVTVILPLGDVDQNACKIGGSGHEEIVVGASTETDEILNYAECVDIFAPGSNIFTTAAPDPTTPRSKQDWLRAQVTSSLAASAHVAAAAALILERNPQAHVKSILMKDATADVLKSIPPGKPNKLLYAGPGALATSA